MDYIQSLMSPVSMVAYSFIGLTCLTFIYGIYGAMLAFLQFLSLGPRRFFRKVNRPTPPAKAMDPIYGEHQMMKLKVTNFFFIFFVELNLFLVVGYFGSLCIERCT